MIAPAAQRAAAPEAAGALKNIALFLAAPFIGLAYIVALPFVGLCVLAVMAARAPAKYIADKRSPCCKECRDGDCRPFPRLRLCRVFPLHRTCALAWIGRSGLVGGARHEIDQCDPSALRQETYKTDFSGGPKGPPDI